jgi:CRISPR-associated protein Csm2
MDLYTDDRKKDKISFDVKWVTNPKGLPKEAIDYADAFGKYLTDPQNGGKKGNNALSTSQLRNFFGEIRRIQLNGYSKHTTDFMMLKPKLAYATARAKRNNRIKDFKDVLIKMIDEVIKTEDIKHFVNFVNFVEATVAYHKANGGE